MYIDWKPDCVVPRSFISAWHAFPLISYFAFSRYQSHRRVRPQRTLLGVRAGTHPLPVAVSWPSQDPLPSLATLRMVRAYSFHC